MDAYELFEKYEKANAFYRDDKPEDALRILDELNRAVPDNPTLMYARAMVLVQLRRHDEADEICDRLIREHGVAHGVRLKAQIAAARADEAEKVTLEKQPAPETTEEPFRETQREDKLELTVELPKLVEAQAESIP